MSSDGVQLPLDGLPGSACTYPNDHESRGVRRPITATQRQIMAHIDKHGSIRSVEAGVMIHRAREGHRFDAHVEHHRTTRIMENGVWRTRTRRGIACCKWSATDGLMAMRRLMARGVVVRGEQRGTWVRS